MAEPSAPLPSGVGLGVLVSKMETKKQIINLIRFVIFFQLAIVGATIFGMPSAKPCD